MSTKSKRVLDSSALIILAVLFVAVTMLSSAVLRGMRLDLTEQQLYTISDGTRNILANLEEPINLYFYFSDRATKEVPSLRAYALRVRELLEELALRAGGKLKLQVIDPLPFSEDEDNAARFGLQGVPVGATGEQVYLGLAGTNSVDDEAIIPFFQPDKEALLEYDIARLIYTLDDPKRPVIGILSTLPMTAGFDMQTQRPREPWAVTTQVEQLFEARTFEPTLTSIDEDVDVLMLVHPKGLSDEALYAIDQFILGGGRAMVFVDPHAEADIPPQDPQNPAAAMFADRSSDLPKLFDAYGIEYDPGTALLDRRAALSVATRPGQAPRPHYALLRLADDNLDNSDPVTQGLGSVNLGVAGTLGLKEERAITLVPLMSSTTEAMTAPSERMRFLPDPTELMEGFAATGTAYVVAARYEGKVQTAFPGGFRDVVPSTDEEEPADPAAPSDHLEESTESVNLIVVADTDLLTDRLWVRVQNFFGQQLLSAFANNGDFVINALDSLTGSNDLISVRGRATFSRPFDTVDQLRRDADERFRSKEQELQLQLSQTESRLSELQSQREDDNTLIMTDQQRDEILKFQDQKIRIRKELRQVRRDLDRDIERLGSWLKAINIGLMPAIISVLALGLVWLRARRRT